MGQSIAASFCYYTHYKFASSFGKQKSSHDFTFVQVQT